MVILNLTLIFIVIFWGILIGSFIFELERQVKSSGSSSSRFKKTTSPTKQYPWRRRSVTEAQNKFFMAIELVTTLQMALTEDHSNVNFYNISNRAASPDWCKPYQNGIAHDWAII